MWQRDFNNTITQTNSRLAGGMVRLSESPHPLPVLHREKSQRLAWRGRGMNAIWTTGVGMDRTFWAYIPRSRDAQ